MRITIDAADGVPIYRQIANQIKYMIASRQLAPGEDLPAIRTLALQLKVTPNTIVKAYDELQASRIVRKRRGAGTFVAQARSPLNDHERLRIVEGRVDALLAAAYQLNFSVDDVLKVVEQRRAVMERRGGKDPARG